MGGVIESVAIGGIDHHRGKFCVCCEPGRVHLLAEGGAQKLLERPEKGFTHRGVLIGRDTVTDMPDGQRARRECQRLRLVQMVDDEAECRRQLSARQLEITAEEPARIRYEAKEAPMEEPRRHGRDR
ncbi:MAG: hypothetical protein AAF844_07430 [Pseudomonadota bacterium]